MTELTASLVFPTPSPPTLAIAGSDHRFPVGAIYAFTGTYGANRAEPAVFTKGSRTVIDSGATLRYPTMTAMLEPEIELVVAIGQDGRDLADEAAAKPVVFGYAVGLDMTRRDLQTQAKNMGRPWEPGKGFDQSAPVSAVVPAAKCGHPTKGAIWVKVNGVVKQKGDLNQHIWQIDETISFLSQYVSIEPGDIIMMGTPAGVGPVAAGEKVEGHIDGVGDLTVTYVAA